MKRREQIRLTPEQQTAFLRDAKKAALATLDKDGFPHVVAMNFLARDGVILMTSYSKAQKVINIRRNPKVAVMVETGRSYSDLCGVMIRGVCEIIEDGSTVEATMRAILGKDTGNPVLGRGPLRSASKRVVLKVVPKKIAAGITANWAAATELPSADHEPDPIGARYFASSGGACLVHAPPLSELVPELHIQKERMGITRHCEIRTLTPLPDERELVMVVHDRL